MITQIRVDDTGDGDAPEPEARLFEVSVGDLLKIGRNVWAVACNYREPTRIARVGARALIGRGGEGSGGSEFRIVARSRGGRRARKWERCWKLTNFRAIYVPVGHPDRGSILDGDGLGVRPFPTRGAAEKHAATPMAVSRRDATGRMARERRENHPRARPGEE